jgi:hypothetical protein
MAVVGQALNFGVTADQASLVTQKVTVDNKTDKKEAKDKGGKVIAVAYYNKTSDINIDGLGVANPTLGSSLSLTSPPQAAVGAVFAEDCNVEQGNEDFTKSTVKGTAYEGISS